MRAIGASEKIASVIARQDELAQRGAKQLEVAGNQAVDQIKAGDVRRRVIEHVEPAERRRRPAEAEIEHVDQQQPGEEHRQRHAGRRHDAADVVDPRALLDRGENAERNGDRHGDDQAEQRQFGRGRQPRGDFGHAPAGRWRANCRDRRGRGRRRSGRTARAAACRARATCGSRRSIAASPRGRRNRPPDRRAARASAGTSR